MKLLKSWISILLMVVLLMGCVSSPPVTTKPSQPVPTNSPLDTGTTDPVQSTEPTQPTEPEPTTAPTEPTQPTEPEPTTAPTEPTQPTEPEPTTAPTEPTECRHEYKKETQVATCTEAGREIRTCVHCGQQQTQALPPIGHEYKWDTKAATCTETGYENQICVNCGLQQTHTLPAIGHNYNNSTVLKEAASCADTGIIRYSCSKCDSSYETVIKGNHRFGDPTHGSPHGYKIVCQDCNYSITDFYTWFENGFSDCDKTAALYTDTIRLKEPAYTGLMSQWSSDWLEWHDHIMDVLQVYGVGEGGGITLGLAISYSKYGGTEAGLRAELECFLDAFESVYGWRPVWTADSLFDTSDAYLGFDTADLFPLYQRASNNMSSTRRDALVKDLIAFYIHRMNLRTGMQLYNSVGKICDYMQYQMLRYDYNFGYNSAYRGLTCGATMCQGYAEIFQLFAEYCGIKSEIVEGTLMGRAHAWNRVTFSDGTVRYVDVTNLGQDYYILVPWSAMEHYFKLK